MADSIEIPVATEIEYRDVRKEKRVVIAKALWERINVEYQPTQGGLTMSEWISILQKTDEDIGITAECCIRPIKDCPSMWRSLFDIMYKDLNRFTRLEKVGKSYRYDLINDFDFSDNECDYNYCTCLDNHPPYKDCDDGYEPSFDNC